MEANMLLKFLIAINIFIVATQGWVSQVIPPIQFWNVKDVRYDKTHTTSYTQWFLDNIYLKGSLAVVVLYLFIGPAEQENSCAAILNHREIYEF